MLDSVLNKKNRMDTFLILICFLKLFECSLVVETNVGLIQGLDNTDGYYEFLGIPYAIVNPENIFGEALPFPVLKHLFYANNSVACPQREEYNNTIIGSLDCLHLNIYVPKSANTTYKLPVLVSIHGGKFEFGFSSKYVFGPKYLVANSIILVTLNYRLGIYGFMCLDIPKVPGNQGLKDQQIALEWIYQNIEYFGGDIRAITVYGQSSGAMSVDLHLQSPHHKLYKRVILQGGVSLMEVNESNRTIPLIVAKHLGLDASNINRALSFLSKIKTETVIEIVDKLNISWRPCVEHDFGQNRFISDFPVNVNRAKVKNVDVIVGVSEIEALLLVDSKSEKYYETFNPFHYYMSKKFSFDNERLIKMENTVRHFYIGERSVSFDVAIDIANFVSDIAFIYPSIRTIKKFIEYDAQNIFLYKFSYEGGRNFLKTIKNMTMPGATHNDDLGYLFDPSFMKNPLTHNDELTVNRMTKLFSNFVRFGNPTPTITDLTPVKWLPVSRDNQNYLNIDNELTSRTGMFHDRIAFWDIFFELNRKYIKFYKSGNNNTGLESDDAKYDMFMGIPYATVDPDNPFGEAIPFPKFDGVFKAFDDSTKCPQREEFNLTITGTLDCLHLNIYVPRSASDINRLPVLISIHGGQFSIGFSGRYTFGPKFLVDHEIILITINYRLGAYGFMCLNTPEVPGNQGLKDQHIALEWIYDNIEFFGGNRNLITLYGQSAGSVSVDFHLQSSYEKLYNRVILQGGCSLIPGITREGDETSALKLAQYLGITTDDLNEAVNFLSRSHPDLITKATLDLNITFTACVEKDFGQKRFITDYPVNKGRAKVKDMDVLIGHTNFEALSTIGYWIQRLKNVESLRPFHDILNIAFDFDSKQMKKLEKLVRQFYIGDNSLSPKIIKELVIFFTDIIYTYPSLRTIHKYLDNGVSNLYFYIFTHDGQRNYVKTVNRITMPGAAHNDEIGYLFDVSFLTDPITPEDQLMINRITALFSNFVKYGNPTPITTEIIPMIWPPVTAESLHYLNVDLELSIGTRMFHDRYAFWDIFYEMNKKYEKGYRSNTTSSHYVKYNDCTLTDLFFILTGF